MSLSKHFYSVDELKAVLLHTHSLYWCQELIVSGYIEEAVSTLFKSWLWNIGSFRLQWLIDAWKTLTSDEIYEHDIMLSAYRLTHIDRDNSLWNIIMLFIQHPTIPDRVTRKTPSFAYGDEIHMYFMRAIFQGKAICACWISQYIENVWNTLDVFAEHSPYKEKYKICLEALQHYDKFIGYTSIAYDMIIKYSAIIMMCIYNKEESFADFKECTYETVQEGRLYPIPVSYIYGITVRGRSSYNNITQFDDIERYLPGCPFWEEKREEATTMYKEDFYDMYFPNGFPSEWSQEEKEKSHGNGLLEPNEKPSMWKYSMNFMSNISRYAWNTTHDYLKELHADCYIESFVKSHITPVDITQLHVEQLKPVKKVLVCK